MILLSDKSNIAVLEEYLNRPDPFACRILSQLLAYGTGNRFLEHWVQLENDKLTAAISRLDGNMTVFCEKANEELTEFLGAVGYNSILADKRILPDCSGGEAVMKYVGGKNVMRPPQNAAIDTAPPIREIYPILTACRTEGFDVPDFDSFYPDMSHRVRHGLARIFSIKVNGQAVSCCMTSAETEKCAVISGVATLPEYRGKGLAGCLVRQMSAALQPRAIFVFCRRELIEFYEGLGFE